MRIDHMREAVVLAAVGSFTKAAHELRITQSALSKHVARMEDELGFTLFDRGAERVCLTAAGKTFCEGASDMVRTHAELVERARYVSRGGKRVVRLGGNMRVPSIMQRAESAACGAVKANLAVELMPAEGFWSSRLVWGNPFEPLDSGKVDLLLVQLAEDEFDDARYERRPLFGEKIAAIVSSESSCDFPGGALLSDFAAANTVVVDTYPGWSDALLDAFDRTGATRPANLRIDRATDVFESALVWASLVPDEVSFADRSTVKSCGAGAEGDRYLRVFEVFDEKAFTQVYAVWLKEAQDDSIDMSVQALLNC